MKVCEAIEVSDHGMAIRIERRDGHDRLIGTAFLSHGPKIIFTMKTGFFAPIDESDLAQDDWDPYPRFRWPKRLKGIGRRLGGWLGGVKASATMTAEELAQRGRSGGEARARKLTAERRIEIARAGGKARMKNLNAEQRVDLARLAGSRKMQKKTRETPISRRRP